MAKLKLIQVVLVTGGGVPSTMETLVSTEIFVLGDAAWITLPTSGDLPGPRPGLKGVSLDNKIFMTGFSYICYVLIEFSVLKFLSVLQF